MPRLSHFIRANREKILAAWETFARALPSAGVMDVEALRDHAGAMLDTITRDLETPETERQRRKKAEGDAPPGDVEMTAASQHGVGRAESGFSIESMFAEFRALRASVIGLWRAEQQQAGADELEEMTRFNESIDQAIAESIAEYKKEADTTRDRFFAVLGHDLRTPLGVILTSSQFLLETAALTDAERAIVLGMERSGRRMTELVRDLLDLALTRLGQGIPVDCVAMDFGEVLREVVAEVATSNPKRRIEIETTGPLNGMWDRGRLAQALSNLVSNAVQHGSPDAPISVSANGAARDTVTIAVTNQGPPIAPDRIHGLFEAMKGHSAGSDRHLGLGLYIVDKIVGAHGGSIEVESSETQGTTFRIALPRRCARAGASAA